MTPGEYPQLTGRAGRRGIDPIGHAVVLFQPDVPFERVAALVGARTYPLRSSFRPSYNMAVNLVRIHPIAEALRLVELSFAQFLVDRSATGLTAAVQKSTRFLDAYRERSHCDKGDFREYWALVRRAREDQRENEEAAAPQQRRAGELAMERLKLGDVVRLGGRGRGMYAVVVGRRNGVPLALTASDALRRLQARDVAGKRAVVGRIEIPRRYLWKHQIRRQVLQQIASFKPRGDEPVAAADDEPDDTVPEPTWREGSGPLWDEIRAHPCHACADRREHERWAQRVDDLERELASQQRRLRSRTEGLARTFERVIGVLREMAYVAGDGDLTGKGERLCRIYNEGDLLVAEVLEHKILEGLDVPDLAAVVSSLVFQARGIAVEPAWPNERVRQGYVQIRRMWRDISHIEERHGVSFCREPDPGFVDGIHAWAGGEPLEEILAFTEMSPGDFVRSAKQVWDLLRQLVEVAADDELAARCRKAANEIYKGVVAYSGSL
jgi:ATP-dependent RNA helicase HelY